MQNIVVHLPHVHTIGTNYCDNTRHKEFKIRSANQDVLYCCDYAEIVVAIFSHQKESEYYGRNRSISFEGIVLEHFSAPTQTGISGKPKVLTRHDVFHSCLSDDSKQDSNKTVEHIKIIIEFLKQCNIMSVEPRVGR